MMDWPRHPLREVAPPHPCQNSLRPDDTVWHLGLDQIESHTGVILAKHRRPFSAAGTSTFYFDERYVLYSKLRPYLNKVVVPDESGIATTELTPLQPLPNLVSRKFLAYYLRSPVFLAYASQNVTGAKMPRVIPDRFWAHELPVPPLSEQTRIVEILDQADRLRHLRTEADAKTNRIILALFFKMFGDPASNPMRWPKCALRELATITTGNTPSRKRSEYFGDAIEWVKSDNLNTPSHYVTGATERLSKFGVRVARTAPPGSTLVTCIAGSRSAIGNSALTEREIAFNQQINAATPLPGVDSWFLYGHFLVGKSLVQEASTGGMKGLVSKNRFGKIEFLKPPLDLQKDFGCRCRQLCEQQQLRLRQGRQFNKLSKTLLYRAFSGELTDIWRNAHAKTLHR